jgi:hypothetical protein
MDIPLIRASDESNCPTTELIVHATLPGLEGKFSPYTVLPSEDPQRTKESDPLRDGRFGNAALQLDALNAFYERERATSDPMRSRCMTG